MTTDLALYLDAVAALVADAAERGIIVTVETAPQMPLAMGNYDLVVQTRMMRQPPTPAQPAFDLDKMCSDATLRLLRRIDAECEHLSDCVTGEFTDAQNRSQDSHDQWEQELRARRPRAPYEKSWGVMRLVFEKAGRFASGGTVKPYDPPQGLVGKYITTGGMR